VGTVKGYPLYSKKHKGRDTSLSVVVGRERFQIKVEVVVLPTPTKPLKEAHVALARQMLEKVDYAGLAKLIQT